MPVKTAAALQRVLDAQPRLGYKVMRSLSAVVSRRMAQTTDALIGERRLSVAGLKAVAFEERGAVRAGPPLVHAESRAQRG